MQGKMAVLGSQALRLQRFNLYDGRTEFKLQGRKSACTTCAGSSEILRWLTPFLGPNMDPKMGSGIGSHFHSFF